MNSRVVRVVMSTVMAVLGTAALVAAGPRQDDLAARRARLMERLGPDTVAVVWSAPARVYSLDVDYEYRQDSHLLYLTGIAQPDTILVLVPGAKATREVLFVREANALREHREGHTLTKAEVTEHSGVRTVYHTSEFEPFLTALFNCQEYGRRRLDLTHDFDVFFEAVAGGRARLALPFGPRPSPSAPLTAPYEFAAKVRDRFLGVAFTDSDPLIAELRQVKTPFEQAIMTRSGVISSDAHKAGMKAARPGRFEYEVEAAIEQVYLANGAMNPGYPSIVGSGPNATILHYGASSRQMQAGEILLVDAAGSYDGYTIDITRSYPISGTYSEAQKDIYRLVLAAQEAGMQAARIGNTTADVEKAAREVIKAGLLKLGLITDAAGDQYRTWYTHGICHWIGMDVHDVGEYARPLAAGMTFVVEPGLYIRPQALDELPDTPEHRAFKAAVLPAVQKYAQIGIRVEDSFLLTEAGLTNLSATVPRTIEDVERFMAGR